MTFIQQYEIEFNYVISFPLKKDLHTNEPFGAMSVYSIQDSDFSSEEISMLHELAGDVGFAIHSFRQESVNAKLKEERLLNYEQTILSFVKLIEQRDTYTAGHTLRVAKYCELIAKEMNLQAKDRKAYKICCLT